MDALILNLTVPRGVHSEPYDLMLIDENRIK